MAGFPAIWRALALERHFELWMGAVLLFGLALTFAPEEEPTMFEPRVSLITLGVADLARARAFYEAGLGFRASSASQGDIVFFQLGGLALALFPRAALAEDAGVAPAGAGFGGLTLAQNVREPEDVDRLLALAQAAGGRITRAAEAAFWGGRTGYFTDPDGHLWEIAWNPHFPLLADGSLRLP